MWQRTKKDLVIDGFSLDISLIGRLCPSGVKAYNTQYAKIPIEPFVVTQKKAIVISD